jgi:5-methylcytosine-specific restriction enzyme A
MLATGIPCGCFAIDTREHDLMPRKPCLEAGCPALALPGKARCAQHHRARDRQRGNSTARGYDYRWQQWSRQVIADHRSIHGDVCPGFDRDAHRIDPRDWCCDHDVGPLCRACNSRKAATTDKQRVTARRGGVGAATAQPPSLPDPLPAARTSLTTNESLERRMCPQCGEQVPKVEIGRPRWFCSDACRRRWHADTSIIRNELAWRLSLPASRHNAAEAARLTALIAARR